MTPEPGANAVHTVECCLAWIRTLPLAEQRWALDDISARLRSDWYIHGAERLRLPETQRKGGGL